MSPRQKLYKIVFETDTRAGRIFDIFLLWAILLSVVIVMAESIPDVSIHHHHRFMVLEWCLTILFALEYIIRIIISPRPIRYIFSFWGLVDILSILPTLITLFLPTYHYFLVVRIFRLLRVFRILKLARFNDEAHAMMVAMRTSLHKISIFLFTIVALVVFLGTIMYVVEEGSPGFTSIPQSIYWAVVTVSTVGYGDMVPHTVLGKVISSFAMILGYAIIAVPTGIVTVAMSKSNTNHLKCNDCLHFNEMKSSYCNKCGTSLPKQHLHEHKHEKGDVHSHEHQN